MLTVAAVRLKLKISSYLSVNRVIKTVRIFTSLARRSMPSSLEADHQLGRSSCCIHFWLLVITAK